MKLKSFAPAATAMALVALGFAACKYDVKGLEAAPKASFTVTSVAGATNKYLLSSTSSNAFRFDWDKATGAYVTGNAVDTVYFPDHGSYRLRLYVFGQNGVDSASQVLTVATDDPAAITPQKILTGNSTRTWILNPDAGALFVGDPGGAQWWANSVGDVTAADRTCLFNDEYTFKMSGNNFSFDDKGDFRVDDESSAPWPSDMAGAGSSIACYPSSALNAAYAGWGSHNNFTYQIISGAPYNKLKVVGTGAHLGLYKAGRDGTIAAPESDNTYDIIELTQTKMVLRKMYSWGQWKFTFKPKP